ncbi:hypothetical protein M4L38_13940 [Staphylococcus equorum]|uniref:hypothetical protein n=1 Tax=Staphylococcus equorum TaxID=246432 RepID=UPI0024084C7A|nr:hypothetical protein [Staphylococcus equorum]MDG0823826.1 hypothetical protein [Staphylococcus equorum]
MMNVQYKWNEEVGKFCLSKKGKFIEPLKALKLFEVDKSSLAESLQMIYFKRTGIVNYEIDPMNYEKNKAIAKEMACWD